MPFWVIRRVQDKKLANCTLAEMDVDVIYSGGMGGECLKVEDARLVSQNLVKLPVITNLVPLTEDSELIIYMEPSGKKKKATAKMAPPRKRAKVMEADTEVAH